MIVLSTCWFSFCSESKTLLAGSGPAMPSLRALLLLPTSGCERSPRLRRLPHPLMHRPPPARHASPMIVLNQSQRRMMKLDQSPAIRLAQPVLHMRNHRIRHEQWPRKLQQSRPLDRLHVSPQVPVPVAQVAEPPPARPSLQLHRHRRAVGQLIPRPQLLKQRLKCRLQGGLHVNFLRNVQSQILKCHHRRCHRTHRSSSKSNFLNPSSPPRSSPPPVPSPESTAAANTAQTSPPTRAKDGSPPHSSGKTSAARPAAHAPAKHPIRRQNASKRKAAPSPEHPQSPPLAVPATPNSSISPAAAAPRQH